MYLALTPAKSMAGHPASYRSTNLWNRSADASNSLALLDPILEVFPAGLPLERSLARPVPVGFTHGRPVELVLGPGVRSENIHLVLLGAPQVLRGGR